MATYLFYVVSAIALLFSAMVVVLRNPITAALSLVGSFFSVSILFVLLHAPFLGVIQILVYAGAILVLFLYVLMLLDLRKEQDEVGSLEWIFRVAALGLIPIIMMLLIPALNVTDETWVQLPETFGSIGSVGKELLGPYALVFEVISLLLLAAMIGVIVLAPKKREKGS